MKISEANRHAIFEEPLLDTNVPSEVVFRFQSKIVAEDLVLTAWWTESSRHAGMQCRVRLLDLIAARKSISPDAAELIEVIEATACNED